MPTEYTGLVVGGPLDGKMLTHRDTVYPVHPAPSVPVSMAETHRIDLPPENPPPFNYYFSSSIYHHGSETRDISFWVPKGMTILDALDAVRTRYQEPNKTKAILLRLARLVWRILPGFAHPTNCRELREAVEDARNHLEDDLI